MGLDKEREEQNNTPHYKGVNPLEGWSREDKFVLLQVLRSFGSRNLKEFSIALPDKSLDEIKHALQYYKMKALRHPTILESNAIEGRSCTNNPQIPLASWAMFLTDNINHKDLQTEVATALRLIADFENIPAAVCTEGFDFKKIYHMLANAVDGKSIQEDKLALAVIDKCLTETAMFTKPFIHTSTLKFILDRSDLKEKKCHNLIKPTDNHELRVIRQLVTQVNYNPLQIPDEYFTSTKPDPSEHNMNSFDFS